MLVLETAQPPTPTVFTELRVTKGKFLNVNTTGVRDAKPLEVLPLLRKRPPNESLPAGSTASNPTEAEVGTPEDSGLREADLVAGGRKRATRRAPKENPAGAGCVLSFSYSGILLKGEATPRRRSK